MLLGDLLTHSHIHTAKENENEKRRIRASYSFHLVFTHTHAHTQHVKFVPHQRTVSCFALHFIPERIFDYVNHRFPFSGFVLSGSGVSMQPVLYTQHTHSHIMHCT